jgi:hypothetical protein
MLEEPRTPTAIAIDRLGEVEADNLNSGVSR